MSRFGPRLAAVAALAAGAIVLGGCFDVGYDVSLKNDGSGTIVMRSVFSKEASAWLAQSKADPTSTMVSKDGRNIAQTRRIENGQLVTEETLSFQNLSEVTATGVRIEVVDLGRSLVGIDTSRIRVGFGPKFDAAGKPSRPPHRDQNELAPFFGGHSFTLTMNLPCAAEKVLPVSINGTEIVPRIEKSWLHGSKVTWEIPMVLVFANDSGTGMDFTVECQSLFGIPAARSGG